MSTLTLENVLEEIRTATGRRDKDTAFTRAVNNAIIELVYKIRMKEFQMTTPFSTVADQYEYALGATEFAVTSVRDLTNNLPLTPREVVQLDSIAADLTVGAGDPTKWSMWEGNLLLYEEIPDAVISMQRRALKRPTKLTALTDVLPTEDEWDDLIMTLSISKGFVSIGQVEQAAAVRKQVDALVAGRETPEAVKKEHTGDQFFSFSDFSQK